jgi:hypothetical protein
MSIRKFQNGDVVIVTDKVSTYSQTHYGAKPGMSGVVEGYGSQGVYRVRLETNRYITERSTAFEKGKPKSSIEVFEEQIDKAVAKIAATRAFIEETQNKIAFMQEVGSDQFDENEFKAYHTLTIIEQSGMSKIEKAKAIAALISGK